ncbi:MAG TPA: hypothetical protein VF572_04790 [Candidatus Saccharimonadales bacterium]|jgi:hypothetical protein
MPTYQTSRPRKSSASRKLPEPSPPSEAQIKHRTHLAQDILVGFVTLVLVSFGLWNHFRPDPLDAITCEKVGATYEVTLKDDKFSRDRLVLNRCDAIKVTNTGDEDYRLAFGEHDKLIQYPGFQMQPLRPGEYFIVSALQGGVYPLHDHIRDKARIIVDIRASQK